MTVRRKLDIPINVLITAPVKMALQRIADDNMISISDIVRASINAAAPLLYEKYSGYLTEAMKEVETQRVQMAIPKPRTRN